MSASAPAPNARFGRFVLGRRLGAGGMGEVYEAELEAPGGFRRRVALKLVHAQHTDDDVYVNALLDEARVLGRISHPYVVQVLECGIEQGRAYLALELVNGKPLSAVLRDKRIDPESALAIMLPVLDALHYVHALRSDDDTPLHIVHRDVSPQNVLLSVDGDVKLSDFGVALAPDRLQTTTATGLVKGKLRYMAPEHASGSRIDARADQFAAAIVMCECLLGEHAYIGKKGDTDLMDHVRRGVVPDVVARLSSVGVERALVDVILRALSPAPRDRFLSCAAFAAALLPFQREKQTSKQRALIATLVESEPASEDTAATQRLRPARAATGTPVEPRGKVRAGFAMTAVDVVRRLPAAERDAVLSLVPATSVRVLESASRLEWVPVEHSVNVVEAIERALGTSRADEFWRLFIEELFTVPFLSSVMNVTWKMMLRQPRRLWRTVPHTYRYLYRDCGEIRFVDAAPTTLRMVWSDAAPQLVTSALWSRAGVSYLDTLFRRGVPSGRVVLEERDPGAGRMTFLITWSADIT